MSKLSDWRNPDTTFTLKQDFNMNGFLINSKPDEAFKVETSSPDVYIRTNTTSNVRLKDNIELTLDDVKRLIEAGRKVLVYYENNLRLDAYNYDEMELLQSVVKF